MWVGVCHLSFYRFNDSSTFNPKKHSKTQLSQRWNLHENSPPNQKKWEFRLTAILLVHCSFWFGVSVVGDVGTDVDTLPDGILSAVVLIIYRLFVMKSNEFYSNSFVVIRNWSNLKSFEFFFEFIVESVGRGLHLHWIQSTYKTLSHRVSFPRLS